MLTIKKGCGVYGGPSAFCTGYNSASVKIRLQRNGYVGTVSLASDGPGAVFTPQVLTDTQSVSTLSLFDVLSTANVDTTLSFTATASAPGARDARLALIAKLVWDPTFSIGYGGVMPAAVKQGERIRSWIVLIRTKYPDPISIYVPPSQQAFVLLSPNPTTGDSIEFVFDGAVAAPGTYPVELRAVNERYFNHLRYSITVTPAP